MFHNEVIKNFVVNTRNILPSWLIQIEFMNIIKTYILHIILAHIIILNISIIVDGRKKLLYNYSYIRDIKPNI